MHEQSQDFSLHPDNHELQPDLAIYPDKDSVPHPEMSIRFNLSHAKDLAQVPGIELNDQHRRQFEYRGNVDENYFYTSSELTQTFNRLMSEHQYWPARDLLYRIIVTVKSNPLELNSELLEVNTERFEAGQIELAQLEKSYAILRSNVGVMENQLPPFKAFITAIESAGSIAAPEADEHTITSNGGTIAENLEAAHGFIVQFDEALGVAREMLQDYEAKYTSPS